MSAAVLFTLVISKYSFCNKCRADKTRCDNKIPNFPYRSYYHEATHYKDQDGKMAVLVCGGCYEGDTCWGRSESRVH